MPTLSFSSFVCVVTNPSPSTSGGYFESMAWILGISFLGISQAKPLMMATDTTLASCSRPYPTHTPVMACVCTTQGESARQSQLTVLMCDLSLGVCPYSLLRALHNAIRRIVRPAHDHADHFGTDSHGDRGEERKDDREECEAHVGIWWWMVGGNGGGVRVRAYTCALSVGASKFDGRRLSEGRVTRKAVE
jgi:hypothetical protein